MMIFLAFFLKKSRQISNCRCRYVDALAGAYGRQIVHCRLFFFLALVFLAKVGEKKRSAHEEQTQDVQVLVLCYACREGRIYQKFAVY